MPNGGDGALGFITLATPKERAIKLAEKKARRAASQVAAKEVGKSIKEDTIQSKLSFRNMLPFSRWEH